MQLIPNQNTPGRCFEACCSRVQQVATPEGLTAFDLDNIRLTAQFVARNGKAFLTGLAAKEHGNPAFNFLKPTHSLFGFFTALCDAYSKVLMPPKGLMDKLRRNSTDRSARSLCHFYVCFQRVY